MSDVKALKLRLKEKKLGVKADKKDTNISDKDNLDTVKKKTADNYVKHWSQGK